MKNDILRILIFTLIVLVASIMIVQGQSSREDIMKRDVERRMANMRILDTLARQTAKNREEIKRKRYTPEYSEQLANDLKVDSKILSDNASLLKSPNTGAFKLLPIPNCKKIKKSKTLEKCFQSLANINEFGNAFSFRENKLAVFAKSDLAIREDYFLTGRYSVQAILVNLGEIELNNLTLQSKGISFLTNFVPGNNYKKLDEQHELFKNGVIFVDYLKTNENERYKYAKLSKIVENQTYALRSIAYRPAGAEVLSKDKDIVIVLKVLENDKKTGSVTIIWKELSSKEGVMIEKENTENSK